MKNTKKLLTAAIMLVIAFTAVVSSTYAWFTLQNPVAIEDVNIDVSSSKGVYVSLDGTTWKTTLTQDDLFNSDASTVKMVESGNYSPVTATVSGSTLDLSSFKKLNSTNQTGAANFTAAGAGTDYSEFTLYLKADSATTLDISSIVASVQTESSVNFGALSMLRIAFINSEEESVTKVFKQYTNTVSGIEVKTNQYINASGSFLTTLDDEEGYNLYTSFYNKENPSFGAFVGNGILAKDTDDNGKIGATGYTGYKAAHDGLLINGGTTAPTSIDDFITVPTYNGTDTVSTNTGSTIYVLKVVVWLDGWDSLCTDALSGSKIKFNFTLSPAAE